jgi:hypothetical protein
VDPRAVGNPKQIARALEVCGSIGRRQGPRFVAFFACMYYAMMRPGEMIHLRGPIATCRRRAVHRRAGGAGGRVGRAQRGGPADHHRCMVGYDEVWIERMDRAGRTTSDQGIVYDSRISSQRVKQRLRMARSHACEDKQKPGQTVSNLAVGMVPRAGFEPAHPAPEAGALSPELTGLDA